MNTANGYRILAAVAVIFALSGCDISVDGDGSTKVNGSVHVAAGKAAEEAHTVNGIIHVDDNAAVTSAGTVNGSVRLGAHATATSAKTVNGAITLGEGAHVSGSAVLGQWRPDSGKRRGGFRLPDQCQRQDQFERRACSRRHQDRERRHPNLGRLSRRRRNSGREAELHSHSTSEDPVIVIGPGAVVQGDLRFERKVRLYVSDKATIGTVTGATPIPFSGDNPRQLKS